jgi:hypothetical protein
MLKEGDRDVKINRVGRKLTLPVYEKKSKWFGHIKQRCL